MKRINTGFTLILFIALVGLSACQATSSTEAETASADTPTEVEAASPIRTKGQIVPMKKSTLAFPVGGQVTGVFVKDGDLVTEGQPLAQLDDTLQKIAVSQAEANLAQAEANLLTVAALPALAQADLEAAQIGVMVAQTQLDLLTADPSTEEIALNQSEVNVAQANLSLAYANHNALLEPATSAQLYTAQSQVTAAEAAKLPVQIAYDQLPENALAETVALLQSQLNAAQAQVNAAQAALNELESGVTLSQQQAANGIVAAARAHQDAAQARLDLFLVGPKPEQVRLAEIGISQAESVAQQAELAVIQAEASVTAAEVGVNQARAALEAAESALEQTVLKAPFSGTVSHLSLTEGERVTPGLTVITVADLSGWQVETTDLTQLDVVRLAVGLPVTIEIEALPEETLDGQIVDISAVSQLAQGDVTYVATIRLDDTALPIRWGMTVNVEIDD